MKFHNLLQTLGAVVLVVLMASPARADLIVVNAADYALGTELTTAFPGLTMFRLTQVGGVTYDPTISGVHTVVEYPIPTQSLGGTFGLSDFLACSTAVGPSPSCLGGYSILEFSFDAPTDFFEIDGYFFTDPNHLVAFDADGNMMTGFTRTSSTGIGGTTRSTLTLSRERPLITRIVYGGFDGSAVTPTQVRYNVPEPATMALVGVGLAGVGMLRRRRRS